VPLTNVNNLLRSYDVITHFPLSPNDKLMNMTPWFHAGGIHTGPCPSLHAGAETVGLKAFNPKLILDCVEKQRLTFLVGAPVSLELLSQAQAMKPRDLSTLKGIVTMGAPLSREACLRYHRLLTPNIFNGYGTTETFWNTFLRPYDLPEKVGSAGCSCTDDVVRVVKIPEGGKQGEPDDLVARDGKQEGEVIIQTLKAPHRYHNKPEDERRNYYKRWYYTKDIGSWDEAGYVTICGRRDDMIISEGENIHPAQIEAVINEHPKVADSVVVGVPDAVKGEAVAAYVVPKDSDLTTRELFQFLTHHPRLAMFKRPRFFKLVERIPMTATGKKQHFVVKAWAREHLEKGELKR
jgi:long-chain acyl-CoA synthetase